MQYYVPDSCIRHWALYSEMEASGWCHLEAARGRRARLMMRVGLCFLLGGVQMLVRLQAAMQTPAYAVFRHTVQSNNTSKHESCVVQWDRNRALQIICWQTKRTLHSAGSGALQPTSTQARLLPVTFYSTTVTIHQDLAKRAILVWQHLFVLVWKPG